MKRGVQEIFCLGNPGLDCEWWKNKEGHLPTSPPSPPVIFPTQHEWHTEGLPFWCTQPGGGPAFWLPSATTMMSSVKI